MRKTTTKRIMPVIVVIINIVNIVTLWKNIEISGLNIKLRGLNAVIAWAKCCYRKYIRGN